MVRGSGILLHPTSLPGPFGIGDLGQSAYTFVDFLASAGQMYWQVLPLGPTGYGDSPYQAFSAFAGNALLVSPHQLLEDDLLPASALDVVPSFPDNRVDFGAVIPYKRQLLELAFAYYRRQDRPELSNSVEDFKRVHRAWLEPFALFMALKDAHDGMPWTEWEPDIASREPRAVARWGKQLAEQVEAYSFWQFLFFRQWNKLRAHATGKGVKIIGDAPIFVAHDSADCWAHPELFYLLADGRPALVAGVPPDYFSATGQLWGNPLYRWDVLAAENYGWWIERLRMVLSTVDILRLDHFRGFAAYWAIPGDAPTAERGTWEPGPGIPFFAAVKRALGSTPIIAEDLGVITPDVVRMRERFGFPGMCVLQFAFGSTDEGPMNPHLPHNHSRNSVAYTGTHDNDTSAGWYSTVSSREKRYVRQYAHTTRTAPKDVAWDLVRVAYASVALTAVIPMQDLLGLGSDARMNLPGRLGGNWQWRCDAAALTEELAARTAALARLYGRVPEKGVAKSVKTGGPIRRAARASKPR